MVCFQQKPFIPSQTAARWFASIDFPLIHLLVSQKFNDLQKISYEIFSKSVTKISKSVTCFSKRCPICDRAAIFVRKEGVLPWPVKLAAAPSMYR